MPAGSLHVIYQGHHKCLTLAARKRIYWQLVVYQNAHPGKDEQAYVVIARRWRIPLSTVQKIAVEGSLKKWPPSGRANVCRLSRNGNLSRRG